MLQIVILGFSITGYGAEGTTIGQVLKHLLSARYPGVVVTEVSYGGLSLDGLSALTKEALSRISGKSIILLEVASSHFPRLGYTEMEALQYIYQISIDALEQPESPSVFYLALPRADLPVNNCATMALLKASAKLGIPIIDFASLVEAGAFETVDGIHPSEQARILTAKAIRDCILPMLDQSEMSVHRGLPPLLDRTHSYEYVDLSEGSPGARLFHYEGRGKSLQALQLEPSESATYEFEEHFFVDGIYFLYGPETGFLDICVDDMPVIRISTYDENSFYRRVGYRSIRTSASRITISCPPERCNIQLRRKTHLAQMGRREFLGGLNVRASLARLPES